MQELIFITDLDLSKHRGTGIGLYIKNLLRNIKTKTTLIGKNKFSRKSGYTASRYISLDAVSNYQYLRKLFSLDKSIIPKDAILISQRPDFMFPFRNLPNKKVITIHGNPAEIIRKKKGLLTYMLFRLFEKPALRECDKVIFIDSKTRDEYLPGLKSKSVIIPPGFNTDAFKPKNKKTLRKKLGLPDKKILIFAGRFEPEKNLDKIISEIVSQDKDMLLLLIGSGSEKEKLLELSDKRIKFLSEKPNKVIADYMAVADATIIMSDSEGVPTMVLEGWSLGIPVITNGAGELRNIVMNGKNGYIIKPGQIVNTLNKIKGMKKACIESSKRYQWKTIAKELTQEYQK